uniref:HTH_Tnp_Tc3_1 domain-containing protein n=1 Tax=Heterorhabditis bacteriophora TaxID=37862 RepID=A0A1I7XRE5_HETBA
MARGSLLNDIEKGEILAFSDARLNLMKIARKIGRSRNVVANFLRASGEYGVKKSGGRSTKLGEREKSRITMMASNNTVSLNEIRSIYCQTASKTTVWRALKANPLIRWERMKKYLLLQQIASEKLHILTRQHCHPRDLQHKGLI